MANGNTRSLDEDLKQSINFETFDGGFTVLLSVYAKDDPAVFQRAIKSIFDNSLQPVSVMLVADGPLTHALDYIVESTARANVNCEVWRLPVNAGLSSALNYGLKKIKTRWIVRADADDINHKERFARLASVASAGRYDIIGSAINEVDGSNGLKTLKRVPVTHEEIVKYIKTRNPMNHMSVAYKTSVVHSVGGYPNIYLREDYGLWARLVHSGARFYNIDEPLVDASGGTALAARRGGLRYALGEVRLQLHLTRLGIKSPFEAILHGLLRFIVFCFPLKIRELIYLKLLR